MKSKLITNKKLPISVSLVIPLYNNEKTLEKNLVKCYEIFSSSIKRFEILICNDTSTDGSEKLLKKLSGKFHSIKYYNHEKNQGAAGTIIDLYGRAKFDYIALFSLDGEWNPEDIYRLINYIYLNKLDIVIGKRNKETYTNYRKTVSFLYNLLPKILFGIETIDAGSIKVFRKEIFQNEIIRSQSLFFEAEMIILAMRHGKKISSLPVTYTREKIGSGTAANYRSVIHSVSDLLSLKFKVT